MNRKARRRAASLARRQTPRRLPAEVAEQLELAYELHRLGRCEEAITEYREVLKRVPDNVDALMNLGTALTALAHRDEALDCYRRAVRVASGTADVHHDCALGLVEFALWEEAIVQLEATLRADPGHPRVRATLGAVLVQLGRRAEALPLLRDALRRNPADAGAHKMLAVALCDEQKFDEAAAAMAAAARHEPDNLWYRYCHRILDVEAGRRASEAAFTDFHPDPGIYVGAIDSWRYIEQRRGPQTRLLGTTRETLVTGLEAAAVDGLVVEFGVRFGQSLRWLAERVSGEVHGFDSFEGLPERWHIQAEGAYSTHGERPLNLPENARLHVGLFDDTLPAFVADHPGPVRFANVDCDLYSSTRSVFQHLEPRLVPGTVLVFDEYLFNDRWRYDEFKAFQELREERGWRHEYLAFSLEGQAVVRLL